MIDLNHSFFYDINLGSFSKFKLINSFFDRYNSNYYMSDNYTKNSKVMALCASKTKITSFSDDVITPNLNKISQNLFILKKIDLNLLNNNFIVNDNLFSSIDYSLINNQVINSKGKYSFNEFSYATKLLEDKCLNNYV